MNRWYKIFDYLIYGLLTFLIVLWIGENKIDINPYWLTIGRLHPLLLHLPIGFLVILVFLFIFKKEFPEELFQKSFRLLATMNAVIAILTAIFGLILSLDEGYNPEQLKLHKWWGLTLAFFAFMISVSSEKTRFQKILLPIGILTMIFAGHFGANITHGENFLTQAFEKKQKFDLEIPIYNSAIFPILENKCLSCHNDKKNKGELNMASLEKLLRGGKNGEIWKAGDALHSHIIQRANLNLDDKKHMPPKGKPQLTNEEIKLLNEWINQGAKTNISFRSLKPENKLKSLIESIFLSTKNAEEKKYTFSAAATSTLEKVNTPFCSVVPLASNSPALSADFYVSQKFDPKVLENLKQISDQLVSLNLNKMAVSDEQIPLISEFKNLEKLNLNNSEITGKNLGLLSKCKNLNSISLSGCKLTNEAFKQLAQLKNIKELYLWNTGISEKDIASFKSTNKEVSVFTGFDESMAEKLKLNPPQLVNKTKVLTGNEKVELKHSLNAVEIRYTTDGTDPDSSTGTIYNKEIRINDFTQITAIASKEGWFSSNLVRFSFFKSGIKADTAYLLSMPHEQYPGNGASTVIDQKAGDKDNFKDKSWIAYKEKNGEILIKCKPTVKNLTISYLISQGSYIMPPSEIEIWAGNDRNNLRKIETKKPRQLSKPEPNTVAGISFSSNQNFTFYKIIVKPLSRLPIWHAGKGQKAWVFLDEIYLN